MAQDSIAACGGTVIPFPKKPGASPEASLPNYRAIGHSIEAAVIEHEHRFHGQTEIGDDAIAALANLPPTHITPDFLERLAWAMAKAVDRGIQRHEQAHGEAVEQMVLRLLAEHDATYHGRMGMSSQEAE